MEMHLTVASGEKAPGFTLARDGGGKISLEDFSGRYLVLYFYPKDDTSGCTKQACAFSEDISAFNDMGVDIVGVSKDDVRSHDKFRDKYGLKFPLASDADGRVCEAYGVWVQKSMYGRKYMGIERTTFLIDPSGMIAHVWNRVQVTGHAAEIMARIKELPALSTEASA